MNEKQTFPRLTRREMLAALQASFIAAGGVALSPFAPLAAAPAATGRDARLYEGIREIENTWIPLSDGVRLAARIWLPRDAAHRRVPAIFNYCPYFARLLTRPEDDARFPYYAAHGYACVRVDIRGSGDSQGRPQDEYVKQEQDDALEIIRWIAAQPWCTGAVGMEGISWSGINSLQVAARRPPALKAIITHCSTDERYGDDAHYKGGCILYDMFDWGTVWLAIQGQASDPAITGESGWRQSWLERLNAVEFNLGRWLEHPDRDAFWKHGSVDEDYSQIQCPVYAIGGWVDAYKNTVFRLLAGLKVPRKGLVGPWTHTYPHQGAPAPAIGYLDEALRWWDHWLKRADTGIMEEPMLRVWMQQRSASPASASVPGAWAAEDTWPSPRVTAREYFLDAEGRMSDRGAAEHAVVLNPVQTVGIAAGKWCPSGAGDPEDLKTELPLDQRQDDARSLVFDSAPLNEDFEMLGACEVTLDLASDKPVAFLAIRLNEVEPTGETSRVTYGIQNLCHRDSDAAPSALEPGRRYTVKVGLDHAAHRFHRGNKLRIAISTAYWPLILPSPEPVALTVFTGTSKASLPVRPPRADDAKLRAFGPPYVPPVPVEVQSLNPGSHVIEWDAVGRRQVIRHASSDSVVLLQEIGTRLLNSAASRAEIGDDSTEAVLESEYAIGWERDGWKPRVRATSKIVTVKTEFVVHGELHAFDGDEKVLTRVWDLKIPRKFV